jgi:hypothetical protein
MNSQWVLKNKDKRERQKKGYVDKSLGIEVGSHVHELQDAEHIVLKENPQIPFD